jgi:hypothetical protein
VECEKRCLGWEEKLYILARKGKEETKEEGEGKDIHAL